MLCRKWYRTVHIIVSCDRFNMCQVSKIVKSMDISECVFDICDVNGAEFRIVCLLQEISNNSVMLSGTLQNEWFDLSIYSSPGIQQHFVFWLRRKSGDQSRYLSVGQPFISSTLSFLVFAWSSTSRIKLHKFLQCSLSFPRLPRSLLLSF